MKLLPKYPVYVISKGRFKNCLTAKFLIEDQVPFWLVVEPQEAKAYSDIFGKDHVRILPFSNLGLGSIPARNWCWEDSIRQGFDRHWIVDDNISYFMRRYLAQRIRCNSGPAFAAIEEFTDRYANIAIAGLNYVMFCPDRKKIPPFTINHHVYSCMLVMNGLKNRWRGRYNEDTDLCLQVLADGWCTILTNAFLIQKKPTMSMKGGNTDELYKADGRLRMARSLERMWPRVVEVKRRFRRPQHVVKSAWSYFNTELKLKPGVKLANFKKNEFGLSLVQKAAIIKSEKMRALLNTQKKVSK